MATSHRRRWLAALCLAAVAGCTSADSGSPGNTSGGPAGTGATGDGPITEPVVLESADGVVRLEVPAGSVREGTDLGIDVVDPADVSGLDGATPVGSAYRIRPEGISFAQPLIVAYRLPLEETGRVDAMPLVITVIESGGSVVRTIEQRTQIGDDGELVHISSIDHFGTRVMLDGGVTFTLAPTDVADLSPGDSFDATLTAEVSGAALDPWPGYDMEVRWLASGSVSEQSDGTETVEDFDPADPDWVVTNAYTCDVVGSGSHGVEIGVDVDRAFDDAPGRQFVELLGGSTCGDVGR